MCNILNHILQISSSNLVKWNLALVKCKNHSIKLCWGGKKDESKENIIRSKEMWNGWDMNHSLGHRLFSLAKVCWNRSGGNDILDQYLHKWNSFQFAFWVYCNAQGCASASAALLCNEGSKNAMRNCFTFNSLRILCW